jgi:hypothetical protein
MKKHKVNSNKSSPIYQVWLDMRHRCNSEKYKRYKDYGGRGIKVCEDWNDFNIFSRDMMPNYEKGLQIDRKDNDGNYCKDNCKWSRRTVNMANRRPLTDLPRGIRLRKNGKYQARIGIDNTEYYLGTFESKEEAHGAFMAIHKEWYGF